ncbi:SUKH-3 domain-containing protein [Catelliglobosispora koreensis]|uniref:SUKH-3 domain-containing protein n=1 Tax=Catelliglobosispora koreensis TaxID=129052 RepID=UPI000372F23C|nr:SUKH-3 domain-containing protein [Catelliglobosispora koreensis]
MGEPITFSEETKLLLREAGWFPGRIRDIADWEAKLSADGFPPLHLAAQQFLSEFGGLAFRHSGGGVTRAREAVRFYPLDCCGEADRFVEWSQELGKSFAPIGELGTGTCSWSFVGIDKHSEVYLIVDGVASFGRMPLALDHLILGYMPEDVA